MSYSVVKKGNKYLIKKKKSGKVVGKSDTKDNALSSIRARYASEAGHKMKNS